MKQATLFAPTYTASNRPLVVNWGLGQDSTGMLVGMKERGIRPDLIIVADVGSERRLTTQLRPIFDDWLESVGFPRSVTVRYTPKNFKHWPPYYSLLENCLTNVTLPSLAYGFHTCSSKWKIQPINSYIAQQEWARQCWRDGQKIRKAIGFDSSPHEQRRAQRGCKTFAVQFDEAERYDLEYPLQQWGWTRADCVAAIMRAGLPVPPKSSCFFCPAMKTFEVESLEADELRTVIVLEARTAARHLDFAKKRAEDEGMAWDGQPSTDGLWRKPVKGMRGAIPKPGSMTQFIRDKGLLPCDEIDRIIAATPTAPFSRDDFARMGFANWQDWLAAIIHPQLQPA